MLRRISYPLLCTLLGLALGWLPKLIHGPIPEKFYPHFIRGDITVWAYYVARLSIGFYVGIALWPPRWWLRGPLLGALLMFPTGLVSLSVPECGSTCMSWNMSTGALVGLLVAGIARAMTGQDRSPV